MGPAGEYLASLPDRPVYRPTDPDRIRALVGGPLPEDGVDAVEVVDALARSIEPHVTAHASGRYFGFVIGGLHPASFGADLLGVTWDQNAGLYAVAQGVAIVEEVAAGWVLDVLGLPSNASVGFVTGGQMANYTCLAAARHRVLREVGWDVEAQGLQGAPKVNIVVKSERHSTIPRALRLLGFGDSTSTLVPSDADSRIDTEELERTLAGLEGPTIVCVEAGNINHGSFDDYSAVADAADRHRTRGNPTWVHVDGAFGLWAAASAATKHLTAGMDRLDSWSTDAHKTLNVGYDSGVAICRHPASHRASMSIQAAYLVQADGAARDQMDWNPEFSRRARGLAVYATLRSLGRAGVDEMVERLCSLARLFAVRLTGSGKAEVVNDVVFNQVLVRWIAPDGNHNDFTDQVITKVQQDGTAYFSGTTWNGHRFMRISVSDWATDESDVERAVAALLRCAG
ncbi:MAG: aspartate aminotransferase family protein [bacterium]|nr:aspartate aminotransferase family protein [bacterium]